MPPSYGDIYFPDEIISRYVRVDDIPYFKLSKASIFSYSMDPTRLNNTTHGCIGSCQQMKWQLDFPF